MTDSRYAIISVAKDGEVGVFESVDEFLEMTEDWYAIEEIDLLASSIGEEFVVRQSNGDFRIEVAESPTRENAELRDILAAAISDRFSGREFNGLEQAIELFLHENGPGYL